MSATLLVIQHVPHERLGTLEPAFKMAGCTIVPLNSYEPKAMWSSLSGIDGIVVMGGPQSVYEQTRYPFLTKELELLRAAIKADLPILGVCLGAQLLAAALGATVTKNPQKEIGWYPVMREPGADGDPLMEPFGQTETVFQWHGDTFALPKGAVRLASSPLCPEQGFRYGTCQWGLQFHVEVTEAMVRAWMQTPINKAELATLKGVIPPPVASAEGGSAPSGAGPLAKRQVVGMIDPMAIRRQSSQHVGRLAELSQHVATTFARTVQDRTSTTSSRARATATLSLHAR